MSSELWRGLRPSLGIALTFGAFGQHAATCAGPGQGMAMLLQAKVEEA